MISKAWKGLVLLVPVAVMAGSIGDGAGVANGLVSRQSLQHWLRPSVLRTDRDAVDGWTVFPAAGVTNGANGYDLSTNVARVVGSNMRLTNGTQYTLSIWAKPKFPEINGASSSAFLWSDRASTTNLDFQLVFDPTTKWTFVAFDTGGNFLRVTNSTFTSNAWHHICVVASSRTNLSIYVNGVSQGRNAITNVLNDASPTNRFGDTSWSATAETTHYRGAFDEPKLWRRALTDYEVMKDYEAGRHWRVGN